MILIEPVILLRIHPLYSEKSPILNLRISNLSNVFSDLIILRRAANSSVLVFFYIIYIIQMRLYIEVHGCHGSRRCLWPMVEF